MLVPAKAGIQSVLFGVNQARVSALLTEMKQPVVYEWKDLSEQADIP
jgi:hypothetical protein